MPGHTKVPGNEQADILRRQDAPNPGLLTQKPVLYTALYDNATDQLPSDVQQFCYQIYQIGYVYATYLSIMTFVPQPADISESWFTTPLTGHSSTA